MAPLALVLVLVAAVLHASWNVLLKTSGDTLRTALRLQFFGTLVLVPIAVVAWFANGSPAVAPAGIAIAAVSGVIEAVYFIFLSAAYRRGDLSLVYPLARGSAPLLAVVVGITLLEERLGPLAAVGVALLLAGILLVSRPWRVLTAAGKADRGAVGFALLTGASIAAYSAVDRVGVRLVEPWLYGAMLAVFAVTFLAVAVAVGRRLGLVVTPAGSEPSGGSSLARDAVAGVLSLTAYLLILIAYSIAPLAAVAPLRESAIVLAAAWGSIRLGEAAGRRESGIRIGAAALVVVGAVFLALER
jgi:drug/metabolite transporter (DMT)-like permease